MADVATCVVAVHERLYGSSNTSHISCETLRHDGTSLIHSAELFKLRLIFRRDRSRSWRRQATGRRRAADLESANGVAEREAERPRRIASYPESRGSRILAGISANCLLYTSDAADERS